MRFRIKPFKLKSFVIDTEDSNKVVYSGSDIRNVENKCADLNLTNSSFYKNAYHAIIARLNETDLDYDIVDLSVLDVTFEGDIELYTFIAKVCRELDLRILTLCNCNNVHTFIVRE